MLQRLLLLHHPLLPPPPPPLLRLPLLLRVQHLQVGPDPGGQVLHLGGPVGVPAGASVAARPRKVHVHQLREEKCGRAGDGPRGALGHHRDDGLAEQVGQGQLAAAGVRDCVARGDAGQEHLAGADAGVDSGVQQVAAAHLAHVHPAGEAAGQLQGRAQQEHLVLAVPVVGDKHLVGRVALLFWKQKKTFLNLHSR